MPPSANLTYGDVTHSQRVQSGSSNPAAPAVDVARVEGDAIFGTVISLGAGLEYGNVQELFDVVDALAAYFQPSESGTDGGMPPPGQNPDEKPDTGQPVKPENPELEAKIDAVVQEVATRAALLGFIAVEGYGRAFLEADAPVVIGREMLGGTWSMGLNWSGASKAYGIAVPLEFNVEEALEKLDEALELMPGDPATFFQMGDVLMYVDPDKPSVRVIFDNDSSLLTKATQLTELNVGYSRPVWGNTAGSLFLGAEAKYYKMRLTRLSVRFGDITDSDELFDAIRHSDFVDDNEVGLDIGALWVADNYLLGAQLTNVNEPEFTFPEVNLEPYRDDDAIRFLRADQVYTMDRQVKLEASLFTTDRRWTANLGLDASAATDPMGDDFQWFTVSAGYAGKSWWLPGARFGYRKNLTGTEIGYLGVGLTVFKFVNIDIASAIETVHISGENLPRGFMASLGFEIAF